MAIKESFSRKLFVGINSSFLVFLAMLTLFPFVNVIAGSFATSLEMLQRPFMLFPRNPTILSYRYILSTPTFVRSIMTTAYVAFVGTLINITMTYLMAYPLSYKRLTGRKIYMNLIVFTMLFSGGMIPGYLNIKQLGLIDSLWALMLPGAISTSSLIILKNFIQQIPDELKEAARIDGASELFILARIIVPLSLPVLATLSLFYAVGHWNSFFNCLLLINDPKKWTIQVLLRQIIMQAAGIGDSESMRGEGARVILPTEGVRNACIIVATMPILLVYPFLQKYFAKGALLGSIKG